MGIHLSGVVAGISTLFALPTFLFRKFLPLPTAIVLWHISGTGYIIAIATTSLFASKSTWLLGKHRKTGQINAFSRLFFWPYHVGIRTKRALQRLFKPKEPYWNQITESYYLGCWPSHTKMTPSPGCSILDVTCELPLAIQTSAYKMIPVWDTHSPSPDQIDEAVAWAKEEKYRGQKILVHCFHGRSRSATILSAILIATGVVDDIESAVALLKSKRPIVKLNHRQQASLRKWYNQHRHKNT